MTTDHKKQIEKSSSSSSLLNVEKTPLIHKDQLVTPAIITVTSAVIHASCCIIQYDVP